MARLDRLRALLEQKQLDGALLCQPENRRYYSGFTGSTGYVLVTAVEALFLTDFRYEQQAALECPGFTIVPLKEGNTVFHELQRRRLLHLAVEVDFISLGFSRRLRDCGVASQHDAGPTTRADRQVKDQEELGRVKRACEITDEAFEHILEVIHPGMTEAEINFELQFFMKRYPGVERMADTFIVASGPRGSMPHGVATGRAVEKGDFVTMDFGCNYKGYWSDVTRTICLGPASAEQKEIYQTVLEAQRRALDRIRPGLTGRQVDSAARDYITAQGHGAHFGHGLGHSFGLEIHESPRCAQNAAGDLPLQAGMLMTLEPGIYIEGFGGVRIEDDVFLTPGGCQVLSQSPRQLIER